MNPIKSNRDRLHIKRNTTEKTMDTDHANVNRSFLEASISSDLALRIIQYLNVVDMGKLGCLSRRYCYLVHQYRRLRGPELATTSTSSIAANPNNTENLDDMRMDDTMDILVKDCLGKLQTMPNLALHFCAPSHSEPFQKELPFGNETIGLSVVSPREIQVYQPEAGVNGEKLEVESHASLMAMNFPGATILPFTMRGLVSEDIKFLERRINFHNKNNDDNFWKATILYACGNISDDIENIPVDLQKLMPNAVIVGGICRDGHVSNPKYTKEELSSMKIKQLDFLLTKCKSRLKKIGDAKAQAIATDTRKGPEKSDVVEHVYDTLKKAEEFFAWDDLSFERRGHGTYFGVILGGNVPVRSVVSRGVHSVLNQNGPPLSFSNLVVEKSQYKLPGGEGVRIFGDDGPIVQLPFDEEGLPVHIIRTVRDKDSGIVYTPEQLMQKYVGRNRVEFVGVKRKDGDGFELSYINNMVQLNIFLVTTDGSEASSESLEGSELDLFVLNGRACMEDMELTMSKLREQTSGEEILGALMYTCSGRGPSAHGLIPERMSDASRFAMAFPNVPCLGFYANGEFGPMALAGKENVFQIGRSMNQAVREMIRVWIYLF